MRNDIIVVNTEINLEVEQDLIPVFSVRKLLYEGFISDDLKSTENILAETEFSSPLCICMCVGGYNVWERYKRARALAQIDCCRVSNLWDGDGSGDWLISAVIGSVIPPFLSLSPRVTAPSLDYSAERTQHTAQRLTGCMKCPDVCLAQDEVMAATWH